jgi:L-threonylcarbamoyladenylate synthase
MVKTQYLKVDAVNPEDDKIQQAARLIRAGELVAFPTETVYGLGADAMNAEAAGNIFTAKGRPADQPLLVHISRMEQAEALVKHIPPEARLLMQQFWPGPLSIILPAREQVPEIIRGGFSGVGLRMPSHPVAMALINAAGPLAAPSANLYGRPSPTSAQHVQADLDGKIAAVLDAGETGSGLESTVLDMNGPMKILRRGGIPVEDIEDLLECCLPAPDDRITGQPAYKSLVQVILSERVEQITPMTRALQQAGKAVGLVRMPDSDHTYPCHFIREYNLKLNESGQSFFSILRAAEQEKIDALIFEPPGSHLEGPGQAVIDRIRRAAAKQD